MSTDHSWDSFIATLVLLYSAEMGGLHPLNRLTKLPHSQRGLLTYVATGM